VTHASGEWGDHTDRLGRAPGELRWFYFQGSRGRLPSADARNPWGESVEPTQASQLSARKRSGGVLEQLERLAGFQVVLHSRRKGSLQLRGYLTIPVGVRRETHRVEIPPPCGTRES
jgi:hypothetical protein